MWHTETGDRILEGAEAKLFAEGLLNLVDDVNLNNENDYQLGIPIFDNLIYNQKISILFIISEGLFKKDVPMIELTAFNEGAIASVFEHIKSNLILELEENIDTYCRNLVTKALIKVGIEDVPLLKSKRLDDWDWAIVSLSDQILWDSDYLQDEILDDSPEIAKLIKTQLGINEDYLIDIPPDPNDDETKTQLRKIRIICRKIIKKRK